MALLPKGAAYQFHAGKPGVMLLQTIQGDLTVERWATSARSKAASVKETDAAHGEFRNASDNKANDSANKLGYRLSRSADSLSSATSTSRTSAGRRHVIRCRSRLFLRALMRDRGVELLLRHGELRRVFGTTNHYGTVDVFAGLYNERLSQAEHASYVENFKSDDVKAMFEAMLADWTNEGFDPFAAPRGNRQRHSAPSTAATARRSRASAWPPNAWSG